MNNKVVSIILWSVLGVVVLAGGFIFYTMLSNPHEKYHRYTSYEIYTERNQLIYDSIKLALVEHVDRYINKVANSSALDGIVVVDNCLNYDIDICFVLAQGEQESHFGTQGMARKTNSVFNVFAFDKFGYEKICENGKYRHPNDCVEPYLKLLKRNYLIDGKTEYDMLNSYVDKAGRRYASDERYESMLTAKISKIKNTTPIDSIYQALKKQALILGID